MHCFIIYIIIHRLEKGKDNLLIHIIWIHNKTYIKYYYLVTSAIVFVDTCIRYFLSVIC